MYSYGGEKRKKEKKILACVPDRYCTEAIERNPKDGPSGKSSSSCYPPPPTSYCPIIPTNELVDIN
jgi:hypothetical protein